MNRNALSLLELNSLLAEVIEIGMPREYWVEAEISELRVVRGHCYLDLVEKREGTNTPVARASAKCWQNTWSVISPYFEKVTGQTLHAGMRVLMLVSANFHPAYGFSWIINDIDPTYTLGDMARKRQAIIEQLKREGVFDMQKELTLPMSCRNIAVVSSANAAGYGDFVDQLENNANGFRFTVRLYPATMQGEGVEQSVIAALNKIYDALSAEDETSPDCVVIIRGGGATSDLSGFDTLALAENVAQFPIPIITGIGHERDESILDMVSHTRVKTPTAAAALLIDHLKRVWDYLLEAQGTLETAARRRMDMEQMRFQRAAQKIPPLFSLFKERQEHRIDRIMRDMVAAAQRSVAANINRIDELRNGMSPMLERTITGESHRLQMLGQRVKALDPKLLLKRGYSITLHEGMIVRDASQLKSGDRIETRVEKGTILSVVDCGGKKKK
ncbi:MAG: exodeoxyribonuclease VII large subunit [Prevotella sp.]|uniref:exodeoxyribonuclease VII large subunit n=1 Tax=Prevotella sp. TaxID=59823 RepID=UPI002A270A58|nr:exodeoxyribonuclease VII large subunit [Prevotella sp.]MDD7317592.1 exodeoxyribonuclease VII large subunit [Prevotellaceae bacterium]MDY4020561.1 exodeoxyribonuclease VII large subunit [Prevotella sp.]